MTTTSPERPARTIAQQVGLNVRAILARERWTQEKAAVSTGLSRVSFGYRIRGRYPFDVAQLASLAEALGVSYNTLVTVPEEGSR